MAKLSDIFILQMGKTPARAKTEYWNNGDNDWVSISDLSSYDKYVGDTKETISDDAVKNSGIKAVPPDTVIMSFKLSIGKTAITVKPTYTNEAIMAFIPTGDFPVFPSYFYHFFSGRDWSKGTNRAVMGNTLNKATLGEMDVATLPIEEQIRIAEHLDKVDNLISLRKQQLSKLDELVKSRFIELFGDPKHSDKYGTKKLSSCVSNKVDMVDGPFGSQVNTKVDYIEKGEIPVIRTVNVKMMQFSADDLKFMSREKYETVIRSQVLPGDVILTKVGTIGNVCIFPNEYQEAVLSTTGSCRIRVDESSTNKVFFAYNLMYLKDKLLEIASTGVQPFLNMNHVKNIDVLDVPLEQQALFADFVEQTDKSKFEIQQSLEKLETLKKALMQKYFG